MRRIVVLAAAALALFARTATAKYEPPTFSEMAFGARVVVVGRIETLRDADYDLRVEERLAGEESATTLRVRRFENWACAERVRPYAVGQRIVAFLERGDDGWRAMGGGCEGEVALDGGSAAWGWQLSMPPGAPEQFSTDRFLAVVRELRSRCRAIGATDYVAAWRGLVASPEPTVVGAALERLDAEADVNPHPADAFAKELVAVLAYPQADVRALAASGLARWLGAAERDAADGRLAEAVRTGPAELRPAAALARLKLDLFDPGRHVGLLLVLSDDSIPLAARIAVAERLKEDAISIPPGIASPRIDAAAIEAVNCIRDPALLLRLSRHLTWLYRHFNDERPNDAAYQRERWLKFFAARAESPPQETPRPSAETEPSADEKWLSPIERAVFVPVDVEDRPKIARLVRVARRARKAEDAGDRAAALDACRDLLSARGWLSPAARAALKDLGVDFDDVERRGRALDAPLNK